MISHFQWKPLFENKQLPGWRISFFAKGQKYEGIYHKDGNIEWTQSTPPIDIKENITSQIHELMLFHVYE